MKSVALAMTSMLAFKAAASWSIDSSFTPAILERPGIVSLAAPCDDGKIFISGAFMSVGGVLRTGLARVLPDGRIDASFDAGQVQYVTAMLPLSDGRLLVGGRIRGSDKQLHTGIFRLETNGILDTQFDGSLPPDMMVQTIVSGADGKVVAAGTGGPKLVRLSSDGDIDNTFQIGNGFGGNVSTVVLQADGKMLVGGDFYYYDGQSYWPKLVRLNANGTRDPTFITPLAFWWDDFVNSLMHRPDGKLWVAGRLEQVALWPNPQDISGYRFRSVALLGPDGALDGSFTNLFGLHQSVRSMAMLDDGRLVVQGEFEWINDIYRPFIARLNVDGSLDTSFVPPVAGSRVVAYSGGRCLLCGLFYRSGNWSTSLVRLNPNGTVDDTFRVVAGSPAEVTSVVRQPDGKWVVAGDFQLANGLPAGGLLRLQIDGSRDTNFNPGMGATGTIRGLATLANGQLLAAGSFTSFDGQPCASICRLHTTGRFDTNFTLSFRGLGMWHPWPAFNGLAQAHDGSTILSGIFSSPRDNLLRLTANSDLDESFSPTWTLAPGYPPLFWADSVVLLPNDGVVVGGTFSDCGIDAEPCSTNFGALVRFDSQGTPDLGFDPLKASIHNAAVKPLAALADGSLLAIHSRRIGRSNLRKISPTGTVDPGFITSATDGGSIRTLFVQNDGMILAGGDFIEFNGLARRYLARLHADGTVDSCFDPGDSVDGAVNGIISQMDGQWMLFGSFTSVGSSRRTGLALVRWDDFCFQPIDAPLGDRTAQSWVLVGPTNRAVLLEVSTDLVSWEPLATNTLSSDGWRIVEPAKTSNRFYRAKLLPEP